MYMTHMTTIYVSNFQIPQMGYVSFKVGSPWNFQLLILRHKDTWATPSFSPQNRMNNGGFEPPSVELNFLNMLLLCYPSRMDMNWHVDDYPIRKITLYQSKNV